MESWCLLGDLGKGSFGKVYKAVHRTTGCQAAVKELNVHVATWEQCLALPEVGLLVRLGAHRNIVELLQVMYDHGRVFLVQELMECSLWDRMCNKRLPPLTERDVASVLRQVLHALAFLHRSGVIHRDVKPENILLGPNGVVKLGDFGLARDVPTHVLLTTARTTTSSTDTERASPLLHSRFAPGTPQDVTARAERPLTMYVSTRWYRAPEILLEGTYGPPVDIWALAVLVPEMLTLRPLFPGKCQSDQILSIARILGFPSMQTWPDGYALLRRKRLVFLAAHNYQPQPISHFVLRGSRELKDFLSKTIVYNPAQRLTADTALQHPLFSLFPEQHEAVKPKLLTPVTTMPCDETSPVVAPETNSIPSEGAFDQPPRQQQQTAVLGAQQLVAADNSAAPPRAVDALLMKQKVPIRHMLFPTHIC